MTQAETAGSKRAVKRIRVPGVSESVPRFWGGEEAVYFCNYCQKAPQVGPGQVAVSVGHDKCVKLGRQKAEAFFEQFEF